MNFCNIADTCDVCWCRDNYIDCQNQNLLGVPYNIPVETKYLQLVDNPISSIHSDVFLGLKNLQDLYFKRNFLDGLPPGITCNEKLLIKCTGVHSDENPKNIPGKFKKNSQKIQE